jgi:hypothetical protein
MIIKKTRTRKEEYIEKEICDICGKEITDEEYEAIIKRKYIYIEPTPKKDIPNGLEVILFVEPNDCCKAIATTDIHKGQNKYLKPNVGTNEKPNYNSVKSAKVI